MAPLQLCLFGGFECRTGTGDVLTFPTRKVRALLAYLATHPDQTHRRDKLADLLWGDEGEGEARANLRKALSRLRQSLPEEARDCLAIEANLLAVRPHGLEVDVGLFSRLATDGTPETLERAAGVHRGAFLEGFADCGQAFEDWLLAERRRLDETLHEVLRRLLDHYVVIGAIDRAIQIALRLIAIDPLQESVHRTLIRLYMYQDRVGAALDQYQRCHDLLERNSG
jgi:DNA-binding SARP family transcriptional activator